MQLVTSLGQRLLTTNLAAWRTYVEDKQRRQTRLQVFCRRQATHRLRVTLEGWHIAASQQQALSRRSFKAFGYLPTTCR